AARETASQAGGGGGFPREGAEHGDPRHPAADPEGRLRDHLALRPRRGRGAVSPPRLQGEEVGPSGLACLTWSAGGRSSASSCRRPTRWSSTTSTGWPRPE